MSSYVGCVLALAIPLAIMAVFIVVGSFVTMYAWNHSVSLIFNWPEITDWWTAFWLNLMCGWLFKSWSFSSKKS